MAQNKKKTSLARLGHLFVEKIIEIIAIVVSICAISISIQTTDRQRLFETRLEINNSKPQLIIEFNKSDSNDKVGLLLRNLGNGTARIQKFRYYLNLTAYQKKDSSFNWVQPDARVFFPDPFYFEDINILTKGYLITATERSDLYLLGSEKHLWRDGRISVNPKLFYETDTRKKIDSLIIEIAYESLNPFDSNTYFLRFCELCTIKNASAPLDEVKYAASQNRQIITEGT